MIFFKGELKPSAQAQVMAVSSALIFDIVKGSFCDGPGVRTTVFFKGCPLKCPWCHNPESQRYEMEIMHFPELCIGCGNCQRAKPCYSLARREVGKPYGAEQLALELIKAKTYYETSGGGVTFSGGEAFGFVDYLTEVAGILKKENIHIAVQTSGFFDYHKFESKLMDKIDLIFFDLKIMDPCKHQKLLGKSNEVILENFKKIIESDITVIPRIPLIPNYVATEENLASIADFLSEHNVGQCEFLYYNPAPNDKLKRLGRRLDPNLPEKPLPPEVHGKWIQFFKHRFSQKKSRLFPVTLG